MRLLLTVLLFVFALDASAQSHLKDTYGYKRIRTPFQLMDTVWQDTTQDVVVARYYVGKNLYDNGAINDTIYIRAPRKQVHRFARFKVSETGHYSIGTTHYWIVRRTEDCVGDDFIYVLSGAF